MKLHRTAVVTCTTSSARRFCPIWTLSGQSVGLGREVRGVVSCLIVLVLLSPMNIPSFGCSVNMNNLVDVCERDLSQFEADGAAGAV